jgi:misacylated tRNA(Ala) deacylase
VVPASLLRATLAGKNMSMMDTPLSATEQLYAADSSVREFEASVIAASGDEIALDRTAFYPGGGGQPHDLGTLTVGERSWQVVGVRKEGALIWHRITGDSSPGVGELVQGRLDWERRHRLMRTHTALHILSAIAYGDYNATVTGGNMEPGEGRLDFEIDNWTPTIAEEMIRKVNEEVARNRPVRVAFLPREEALRLPDLIRTKTNLIPETVTVIRLVEIEGLDRQADGGTHVQATGEIGTVTLRGTRSKGASNKRIMIGVDG